MLTIEKTLRTVTLLLWQCGSDVDARCADACQEGGMACPDTSHEAESGAWAVIEDPPRADSATDGAAEFPTMPPGMYGAGSADSPAVSEF